MAGLPPVTVEEFERKTGAGKETTVPDIYHRDQQGEKVTVTVNRFQLSLYRGHVKHLRFRVRFRGRKPI